LESPIRPRQLEGSVEWFMTPGVATIEADADLATRTQALVDMRVGALPVVHNGDLVGILSVTDVLKEAARRFA
jgi:CBS domain-containing protein